MHVELISRSHRRSEVKLKAKERDSELSFPQDISPFEDFSHLISDSQSLDARRTASFHGLDKRQIAYFNDFSRLLSPLC